MAWNICVAASNLVVNILKPADAPEKLPKKQSNNIGWKCVYRGW